MTVTCESCRKPTTHRLTYDAATGFLSCHTCCEATEEVQVSDNQPNPAACAICGRWTKFGGMSHKSDLCPGTGNCGRNTTFKVHRTMVVVHSPGRNDPYRLYRLKDSVEIGYAETLNGIIVLADQYNEMGSA